MIAIERRGGGIIYNRSSKEKEHPSYLGSTDALVHVRPSRHASYPLQYLVQSGQMEGAWCDNDQMVHYGYDGLLTGREKNQRADQKKSNKFYAVMIVFNLDRSVVIRVVITGKRVM